MWRGARRTDAARTRAWRRRPARSKTVSTTLPRWGGLLRLDGGVVAYTMGLPLNSDTFIVHIEKAFSSVAGAYPMINQQFVSHNCADYRYVNREDDVGSEGLRKAKLSWHPVDMARKYRIEQR